MKREDVEALLADTGSAEFAETEIRVTRAKVAALCRAWLAVDGAAEGRLDIGRNDIDDSDMVEIVTDPDTVRHLLYQRVRIVPTPNATEGES